MPATRVSSEWIDGNLVFKDKDGAIIFTIDGINRAINIPTGSALTNDGETIVVTDPDGLYLEVDGSDELTLTSAAKAKLVHTLYERVAVGDVNAGKTLLPAIDGFKYRLVDAKAISVGGAAAAVTTVDILGTQSSASVKLIALTQANLLQSAVLRAGGTGAAVLADGASFMPCDENTAITIGKTGNDVTTATHIDVHLQYVIEEASE